MSGGRSEMSWCWNNFSGGVDAVTRDLARAMGDDDRAIFSIWSPFEPHLVLASNRLDGSQHGIPVRRPKKGSWLGIRFSFGLGNLTTGTKASEDSAFHVG